jgi:hypothetical protein
MTVARRAVRRVGNREVGCIFVGEAEVVGV